MRRRSISPPSSIGGSFQPGGEVAVALAGEVCVFLAIARLAVAREAAPAALSGRQCFRDRIDDRERGHIVKITALIGPGGEDPPAWRGVTRRGARQRVLCEEPVAIAIAEQDELVDALGDHNAGRSEIRRRPWHARRAIIRGLEARMLELVERTAGEIAEDRPYGPECCRREILAGAGESIEKTDNTVSMPSPMTDGGGSARVYELDAAA